MATEQRDPAQPQKQQLPAQNARLHELRMLVQARAGEKGTRPALRRALSLVLHAVPEILAEHAAPPCDDPAISSPRLLTIASAMGPSASSRTSRTSTVFTGTREMSDPEFRPRSPRSPRSPRAVKKEQLWRTRLTAASSAASSVRDTEELVAMSHMSPRRSRCVTTASAAALLRDTAELLAAISPQQPWSVDALRRCFGRQFSELQILEERHESQMKLFEELRAVQRSQGPGHQVGEVQERLRESEKKYQYHMQGAPNAKRRAQERISRAALHEQICAKRSAEMQARAVRMHEERLQVGAHLHVGAVAEKANGVQGHVELMSLLSPRGDCRGNSELEAKVAELERDELQWEKIVAANLDLRERLASLRATVGSKQQPIGGVNKAVSKRNASGASAS